MQNPNPRPWRMCAVSNQSAAGSSTFPMTSGIYPSPIIRGDSSLLMGSTYDTRRGISIGRHSIVNEKCRLDNRGELTIGNNVSISSEVMILTATHDVQSPVFATVSSPVVIDDYAWIGAR